MFFCEPVERRLDRLDGIPRLGRRTPNHHDRDAELASSNNFRLGGGTAARLADEHIDRMALEQVTLLWQRERPASEHDLVKVQWQTLARWVDEPDEEAYPCRRCKA